MAKPRKRLTCGSLFDGIGCFSLAFARAGWNLRWTCEIDEDCRRVTAARFPGVKQYADVRDVGRSNLEPVDAVFGGFPCQDLSVAGKRAGLAGGRSGLWSEFRRVLAELAPRWCLIENVPGLRSSWSGDTPGSLGIDPGPGREMVLEERSDLDVVTAGLGELGYWWSFASLDAQYYGLAQRRERVFIVGRLGDVRRLRGKKPRDDARRLRGLPAQVLFEPDCLPGHPPPGRKAESRTAPSVTPGARRASGNRGGEQLTVQDPPLPVACGQPARYGKGPDSDVTDTLIASPLLGHHPRDTTDGHVVAHSLRAAGCDAVRGRHRQGNAAGAGDVRRTGEGHQTYQPSDTVNSTNSSAKQDHAFGSETARSLDTTGGMASNQGGTVIAFEERGREGGRNLELQEELAPALRGKAGGGKSGHNNILAGMTVRRLTPTETLRLQGLPDDFLDVDPPLSDSKKYHMVGNGGAVPVVEWIAARIAAVEHNLKGTT